MDPYDMIVGDDDGLVVVPKSIARQVLERAENQLMADRRAQKPYLDMFGITFP